MANSSNKILQQMMLEMLIQFDKFCKEKKLTYFLCGGCLIGTIRHKGFIPWDDDVDLFMPRPDYERLKELWNDNVIDGKYVYCRTDKDHIYHDAGASIRDITTTYINRHSVDEDIVQGIAIEIMPLDGCPKGHIARARQLYNACVFNLFNTQRLPDNKGKLIRITAGLLYKLIPSKERRFAIWKRAENRMISYKWENSDEITELIGSLKGMLLRHPKTDFDKIIYKEFEGYMLPVMVGYDKYLKKIWGNYMKLPKVEDRVAKHDVYFMDLNKPYIEYKGIKYCINKKER